MGASVRSCTRPLACASACASRQPQPSSSGPLSRRQFNGPLQPHKTSRQRWQPAASVSEEPPAPATGPGELVTFKEVQDVAAARGIYLYRRQLGPFYRIVCRQGGEEGRVLGVTNGFVVPLLGIMHCETLQIFTKGLQGEEGDALRGGALGLGLLLGGATFAHGHALGCRTAEILAINDDDAWHQRLVGYYSRFGFVPVRVVEGGSLADLPHMLVWGGAGTRMDADVQGMLRRWSPAIRRSRRRGGGGGGGGQSEA